MTRGVLLYAFNNGHFDYIKMANICANRIKHFLKIDNIGIVTDHNSPGDIFSNIINISIDGILGGNRHIGNTEVKFLNAGRYQSYDLSPWDETLIIDVDLLLHSSVLNYVWNSKYDFLIANSINPIDNIKLSSMESIGGLSTLWATVIYFKKTDRTKLIFNLVKNIHSNWKWYRHRYNIQEPLFRNDYAFTIATHIISNGIINKEFHLPYCINTSVSLTPTEIEMNSVRLSNDKIDLMTQHSDIHYINKEMVYNYE